MPGKNPFFAFLLLNVINLWSSIEMCSVFIFLLGETVTPLHVLFSTTAAAAASKAKLRIIK